MRVKCKHCQKGFDVPNAVTLSVAGNLVQKSVSKELAKIEEFGLREWIKGRGLSIRAFARLMNVSSKTVDNWLRVDRLTAVAKQAIEMGLVRLALGMRKGGAE